MTLGSEFDAFLAELARLGRVVVNALAAIGLAIVIVAGAAWFKRDQIVEWYRELPVVFATKCGPGTR